MKRPTRKPSCPPTRYTPLLEWLDERALPASLFAGLGNLLPTVASVPALVSPLVAGTAPADVRVMSDVLPVELGATAPLLGSLLPDLSVTTGLLDLGVSQAASAATPLGLALSVALDGLASVDVAAPLAGADLISTAIQLPGLVDVALEVPTAGPITAEVAAPVLGVGPVVVTVPTAGPITAEVSLPVLGVGPVVVSVPPLTVTTGDGGTPPPPPANGGGDTGGTTPAPTPPPTNGGDTGTPTPPVSPPTGGTGGNVPPVTTPTTPPTTDATPPPVTGGSPPVVVPTVPTGDGSASPNAPVAPASGPDGLPDAVVFQPGAGVAAAAQDGATGGTAEAAAVAEATAFVSAEVAAPVTLGGTLSGNGDPAAVVPDAVLAGFVPPAGDAPRESAFVPAPPDASAAPPGDAVLDAAQLLKQFLPFDPSALRAGVDGFLAGLDATLPEMEDMLVGPEVWYVVAAGAALYAARRTRNRARPTQVARATPAALRPAGL